jgi:hypothetical protein
VQADILRRVDQAFEQRVGCSFAVGHELTRTAKPYLACCYCGEFFVFELSPSQVACMDLQPKMIVCVHTFSEQDHGVKPAPVVYLEEVQVDHADALDAIAPITGTIRYRTDEFFTEPLVIKAVCDVPGVASMELYHHLFSLIPPEGTIRFTLAAIGEVPFPSKEPIAGVLPLYFQICTPGDKTNPPSPPPTPFTHPKSKPAKPTHAPTWKPAGMPGWSGIKPVAPATSLYPPTYDPGPQVPASPSPERPLSDIRAVLVEIA